MSYEEEWNKRWETLSKERDRLWVLRKSCTRRMVGYRRQDTPENRARYRKDKYKRKIYGQRITAITKTLVNMRYNKYYRPHKEVWRVGFAYTLFNKRHRDFTPFERAIYNNKMKAQSRKRLGRN